MPVTPIIRTYLFGSAIFANLAFAFRLTENNRNQLSRSHAAKDNSTFVGLAGDHSESLNIDNGNFVPLPITPLLPTSHVVGFPPIRHTPPGPPASRVPPTSPISPTNRWSSEGGTNHAAKEDLVRPLRLWKKDTDTFILTDADNALDKANTIEIVPANRGNDEAKGSNTDDRFAERNHKADNGLLLTLESDEEQEAFATTAEKRGEQKDLITLEVDEGKPIFERTFDEDRYSASDAFSNSSYWEELAKAWDDTLAPLSFDEYWSKVWVDDAALDALNHRPLQGDMS